MKMITNITHPKFNIANVSVEQRFDCLNQLIDARDSGLITHEESLDIACNQWHAQYKISKLK